MTNLPMNADVLSEVSQENVRQLMKWGIQHHPNGTGLTPHTADIARARCEHATKENKCTWQLILDEEVQEAFAETDPARLREELIQVAAVAVQWVRALDEKTKGTQS